MSIKDLVLLFVFFGNRLGLIRDGVRTSVVFLFSLFLRVLFFLLRIKVDQNVRLANEGGGGKD